MTTFHSIDELLKMMSREQLLLKQMFGKRKQQSFRREYALELTEYKLQRIQSLIDHGVLRENGSFLEMEDIYLHFFEQVLEVNEEINTSFVNEHISYLKDTISYYQQENHEKRKTTYLRTIKRILRNIALTTLRNVIDLKRNMTTFHSIDELLKMMSREQLLLKQMFGKRKQQSFRREYALELTEYKLQRIQSLIDHGVLRENGSFLEMEDIYLHFFEQVLEVNEEINTSFVNEHISYLKDTISYYQQENHEKRKTTYLRTIKRILRNIALTTLRNVIDLKRNIDSTFKNEPNYQIKKKKLVRLDEKRRDIEALIRVSEELLVTEEDRFFRRVPDDELVLVVANVRIQLNECFHNLIEIQKQIISYLNRIEYQNKIRVKIRQLKYLKDQFELEERTDICRVLMQKDSVWFEPAPAYPLRLSVEYLRNDDEVLESIRKVIATVGKRAILARNVADNIAEESLETHISEEAYINLEEVKKRFMQADGDLFSFVTAYPFTQEVSFDERITFYCQIVSQFYEELRITDEYGRMDGVEYALIYPERTGEIV